jgi:hypothetical protein
LPIRGFTGALLGLHFFNKESGESKEGGKGKGILNLRSSGVIPCGPEQQLGISSPPQTLSLTFVGNSEILGEPLLQSVMTTKSKNKAFPTR